MGQYKLSLGHHATGLVWLLVCWSACLGNQMDPHVYPTNGPFFEGWYMRIIDPSQEVSCGWLFGRVLPEEKNRVNVSAETQLKSFQASKFSQKYGAKSGVEETLLHGTSTDLPLVYSSLLLSVNPSQKLTGVTGFFPVSQYKVTKNGRPVVKNPDDKTPPEFTATISQNVTFVVTANGTNFRLDIGEYILQGKTSAPVAWGPHGAGPEGELEHLPLPIHWFVYSLRSEVTTYELTNKATGQRIKGGSQPGRPVVAHMEKDWGGSFPKAWIWAEGVDPARNISFAISSGLVSFSKLSLKAQLSGYRNPAKKIDCSFSPINSIHSLTHDGCAGTATLDVSGLECRVVFHLTAEPKSFSSCLYTPQVDGFRKGCIESYTATAHISVYQGLEKVLTDQQTIPFSALEFGEEYMCNSTCPT